MLTKDEKIKIVNELKDEIKRYKSIGIINVSKVPDNLLQKMRNELRNDVKVIITRKNLIIRALKESGLEGLVNYITNENFALILSNKEPAEINALISRYEKKLPPKPKSIAPEDIVVEPIEVNIPPQSVSEVKAAGIDIQIQKGKAKIMKRKVLVEKGSKISSRMAKVLTLLGITPFTAKIDILAIENSNLIFNKEALKINKELLINEITKAFKESYLLSVEANIITSYNIKEFINRAYRNALTLGIERNIYEKEIMPYLVTKVLNIVNSLNNMIKKE